jgi:hypothetical protein
MPIVIGALVFGDKTPSTRISNVYVPATKLPKESDSEGVAGVVVDMFQLPKST